MIPFSNAARLEAKEPGGPVRVDSVAAGLWTTRDSDPNPKGPAPVHEAIVLIEPRTLIRECLTTCLEAASVGETVHSFATVPDWLQARPSHAVAPLILLGAPECDSAQIDRAIAVLTRADPSASIVLLADGMSSAHVTGALDKGARGYIPTSMPFSVTLKALHLVRAGGTFVPAETLTAPKLVARDATGPAAPSPKSRFTARQLAVIDALRQGKANKVIAFELNMQESTVKVHVRNIMKKLQAKNRTEVAFRVNAMDTFEKGRDPTCPSLFTKCLP